VDLNEKPGLTKEQVVKRTTRKNKIELQRKPPPQQGSKCALGKFKKQKIGKDVKRKLLERGDPVSVDRVLRGKEATQVGHW
jgi:hypothetical protein